jgi:penicillin-binding protein 1A
MDNQMTSDFLRKAILAVAAVGAAITLAVVVLVIVAVQGLPSYDKLADYRPPITTRVHAGDGTLIAEFAEEQRVFVPIQSIPEKLQHAFISAEDKKFFEHKGIDFAGLVRATLHNLMTIFNDDRLQGASTITQQVAKNMLLTSDRTIMRKIKEAFLAQRIERAFDKQKILELYLNEISLGNRSFGVASAALNYFNKPLDELSVGEMAYLAALPKGPSQYFPLSDPQKKERAIARRNYVLARMTENGYISKEEADTAAQQDVVTQNRMSEARYQAAGNFVEELRRQVVADYGKEQVYEGGLSIRSTLNPDMQVSAVKALRKGLEQYDRRHGWRGPLKQINLNGDVGAQLRTDVPTPPTLTGWSRAVVVSASSSAVKIRLAGGAERQLANEDVRWAAEGARRKKERALTPGAAIYVLCPQGDGRCNLRQIPEVQGALVAMDPHTGRVYAMVGGYNWQDAGLNRATQAQRQPGSSFKSIVYAAAMAPCLEPGQRGCGLTPASLVNDEAFEIAAGDGSTWRPQNYEEGEFGGPTTLRTGLAKSRNVMTALLAIEMTPERIVSLAEKLGVYDPGKQQAVYSVALGVGETTLVRMTTAYAMFVNGGKRVTPSLYDRIQDRDGVTQFRSDKRECAGCAGPFAGLDNAPVLADPREQVLDPITAYQVVSLNQSVVEAGTGAAVNTVGKVLGGKTGTSQDYKDAWFVGFSPDLAVGVWIGFDQPRDMGRGETGGRMAAPIFADFMREAMKKTPSTPFRAPSGIRFVRVDAKTGVLPNATSENLILEAFRPGTEPTTDNPADAPMIRFQDGTSIDPRELAEFRDAFGAEDTIGFGTGEITPGIDAPVSPVNDTVTPSPRRPERQDGEIGLE